MGLPSPATGTELYLAAIYEELRALRAGLAGGGQDQQQPVGSSVPVTGLGDPAPAAMRDDGAAKPPVKRTRSRSPR